MEIEKKHLIVKLVTQLSHRISDIGWNLRRSLPLLAALLSLMFGLTSPASAVPITYTLYVSSANVNGTLGTTPFTNASLVYTFEGDTGNVMPYSIIGANGLPTTGYQILQGTASVRITNPSGLLLTATFLPQAGIYVSTDATNGGVGFGSFGALPTDPGFPGEPIYPDAMLTNTVGTYDLTGNFSTGLGYAISCVGFGIIPGCGAPLALPTTAGELLIEHHNIAASIFLSEEHEPVSTSFSSLRARASATDRGFRLSALFTLGVGSNGINPANEFVSIDFGPASVSIPQGSLQKDSDGNFVFVGIVNGVGLKAKIAPQATGGYRLTARAYGVNLAALANPVTVKIAIGDDNGTTSVKADFDDDEDDDVDED